MCLEFVRLKREEIARKGLRPLLVLHLFTLWDYGMVASRHIDEVLAVVDGL